MTLKFKADGTVDLYGEDQTSTAAAGATVAPNSGSNQSQTADSGSIYLWNPNAINATRLFPTRFPSTINSFNDLVQLIRDDMSYQERLTLKRRMWSAGLYAVDPGEITTNDEGNPETGYQIGAGLTGKWEAADEQALRALVDKYKTENTKVGRTGAAQDLESIFSDELLTATKTTRENLIGNYDLPGLSISLQDWAQKEIGRNLTDAEAQKILQQTFAFDREPGEASAVTQWSADNTSMDPLAKKQIVVGGGPDSSAINFGKGLAATYNLTVDTGFTTNPIRIGATEEFQDAFQEGRAVKITGNLQRLIKLHEWANTQKTEDGVFENVRFIYEGNSAEPSGLLLSMRDGAQVPPLGIAGSSFSQTGTDFDKFLDSVKRPGDVYAYSWEGEGPNRRGAYGLSDQIWEFYSNQLGIDSGDTSITAQDRVARAYVSDLWNRYKSWNEVALALRINEETANRRLADREAQGSGYVDVVTDPSDLAWAASVVEKMGDWKPVLDVQKSTDLYSSMYGENTNYIPSNLFAGPTLPGDQTKNKMLYLAQKVYSNEISANKILKNVMELASKRPVRDFSNLERKW